MPASASTPTQPRSTACATRSSQASPAATVTSTPPQVGSSPSTSACTPLVATSTTVPSKPSSATTRLLPPPSTQDAAPSAASSPRSAPARWSRAPTRWPVRRAAAWCGRRAALSSQGARTTALGMPSTFCPPEVTVSATVVRPSSGSLASPATSTVDAALGRYDDRRGELAAERDHLGAREPVRDRPRGQRHGVHAVRDHAGQPDAAGHLLVLVDRVVVAARLGVRAPGRRG